MNELYTAVDLPSIKCLNMIGLSHVYDFAKVIKVEADDMVKFINSSVAKEVRDTVEELDAYLAGGNKQLREAYGHIPKPVLERLSTYTDS